MSESVEYFAGTDAIVTTTDEDEDEDENSQETSRRVLRSQITSTEATSKSTTLHYRVQDDIKAFRASSLVTIPLRMEAKG